MCNNDKPHVVSTRTTRALRGAGTGLDRTCYFWRPRGAPTGPQPVRCARCLCAQSVCGTHVVALADPCNGSSSQGAGGARPRSAVRVRRARRPAGGGAAPVSHARVPRPPPGAPGGGRPAPLLFSRVPGPVPVPDIRLYPPRPTAGAARYYLLKKSQGAKHGSKDQTLFTHL